MLSKLSQIKQHVPHMVYTHLIETHTTTNTQTIIYGLRSWPLHIIWSSYLYQFDFPLRSPFTYSCTQYRKANSNPLTYTTNPNNHPHLTSLHFLLSTTELYYYKFVFFSFPWYFEYFLHILLLLYLACSQGCSLATYLRSFFSLNVNLLASFSFHFLYGLSYHS